MNGDICVEAGMWRKLGSCLRMHEALYNMYSSGQDEFFVDFTAG